MVNIWVVCHDKHSFNYFQNLNCDTPNLDKFKYILVGDHKKRPEWLPSGSVVAALLPNNIECHKTLLTFTAWYALVHNGFVNGKHIGVLEYDCEVVKDLFYDTSLYSHDFIGFLKRPFPDVMFSDAIPHFAEIFPIRDFEVGDYWMPTTNCIMSPDFIRLFVDWYVPYIGKILPFPNHPHYHERALHIFRHPLCDLRKYVAGYANHVQANSHGVNCFES